MNITFYTTTDSLAGMFATNRAMQLLWKHKIDFELKGVLGQEYLVLNDGIYEEDYPSVFKELPPYLKIK